MQASNASTNSPTAPKLGGPYAWYSLGLLMAVYIVNVIDRQIISILAQDIKVDLGITDADLGFLYGTAFAIFYSLFGIPFGRLADLWYRGRLIAIGLFFWSSMTALSGFATSYAMLVVARTGVAIGESSATPAAWSMLGDLFTKNRRALVNALYASAAIIGGSLSLPIGGWVAANWNRVYPDGTGPLGLVGWQAAFLTVGLPGLMLAILVFFMREPMRGASDGTAEAPVQPRAWRTFGLEIAAILPPLTFWSASRIPGGLKVNLMVFVGVAVVAALMIYGTGDVAQWCAYGFGIYSVSSWVQRLRARDPETYSFIWGSHTVLFAIAGFGALAAFSVSIHFWVSPYALRTFAVGKEEVGWAIGLPTATAAAIGLIVGGRLSDFWVQRDPRGRVFVSMLSVILPVPFLLAMMFTESFIMFAVLNACGVVTLHFWGASAVSAMQEFVPPRLRGTIMATHGLGATMIGSALGPYFSGKVATITGSLQLGILSLLVICPIVLFLLWCVCRGLKASRDK